MRMSCNGCRVLRKACGDDCTIKPCLKWIKSPDSQAHATLFLAKFYGRAGLLNLLNFGPITQRPAIFRSLLYEACGRIVNPVYGSVGLQHSGHWQQCQSAVEAVLRGIPIAPFTSEASAVDVRHVSKDGSLSRPGFRNAKKARARSRSKRASINMKGSLIEPDQLELTWSNSHHQSSLSHQSDNEEEAATGQEGESKSMAAEIGAGDVEDGLELTLAVRPIKKRRYDGYGEDCNIELGTSGSGC